MARDFFEATQGARSRLNQTEQRLFDYVVRNMDAVKEYSIQRFARECYLSTTTIFRFARKLGFAGYTDFINSLLVTEHHNRSATVPAALKSKSYSDEYLKNVIETVRVIPQASVARVLEALRAEPNVYILCDADANDIGRYCERLLLGLGLRTYFPEAGYQVTAMMDQVRDGDLVIALSYSGDDPQLVTALERVLSGADAFLMSITRADNNTIQAMSDANFYVFADEVAINGINMTSQVGILIVLELLAYQALDAGDAPAAPPRRAHANASASA
ncbi:MAG: MurR/RpiR family transcriptional regulator [Bifidobacteriaceae bacterium]|jgi:RpiR family glv operon transcriptional regulator|nr:MurR/RpiR family transcriptional regulator [Bifidobacteriaceae bacterium]